MCSAGAKDWEYGIVAKLNWRSCKIQGVGARMVEKLQYGGK